MATIENPTVQAYRDTMHINNIEFPPLSLRADLVTVTKFCADQTPPWILGSYVADNVRFSNDGARLYNYYDATKSEWINAWGHSPVVTEITYTT